MADDAPAPTYQPARIDESQLSVGRLVECTIIGKVDPKGPKGKAAGYEVEIGASQRAFVPRTHVALRPNATSSTGSVIGKGWAELPIGSVLEGQVLAMDGVKVNVSIARRQTTLAWQRVSQLADLDVTIDATVLRLSDAGAALDVEGLFAFLPWSHWGVAPEDRSWRLHGTRLPVKFLEADRSKRRLVVSNRRVRLESATALLEPGGVVDGTVKSLRTYGAVVTLESGVEALLHVSQISQVFVQNVSDVLGEGDAVRCVVIKVDADDGSISLSTKMLESKPGEMLRNASAVFERSSSAAQVDGAAAAA